MSLPLNTLKNRITDHVEHCYLEAELTMSRTFPRPAVSFNQRGKIAGCARLQPNELRFNLELLEDNLDQFLSEVVPHEICHLLAYQLYGKVKPHGREWKSLMTQIYKLPGTATHNMNVSKVMGRTFSYSCLCGDIRLSIRRHNKVLKGMRYQCRKCKQHLVAV